MGVALQVFYNLGQLNDILVMVLNSYMEAVQHEIQNSVDPSYILQSFNGTNKHTVLVLITTCNSNWYYVRVHIA